MRLSCPYQYIYVPGLRSNGPPPPGHVVSQSSWGPGPGISYGMAATGLLQLLVALLLTCCWPGNCQPAARSKQPAAVSSSSQPAGQQASQPSCTQPASQPASHPKPPPHRWGAGKSMAHRPQAPTPTHRGGGGEHKDLGGEGVALTSSTLRPIANSPHFIPQLVGATGEKQKHAMLLDIAYATDGQKSDCRLP